MTFLKRLCSTIVLLALFACIVFGNPLMSYAAIMPVALFIAFFAPYEMADMIFRSGKKIWRKTAGFVTAFFVLLSLVAFGRSFENMWFVTSMVLYISGMLCFALPWILMLFSKNSKDYLEGLMNTIGTATFFTVPMVMLLTFYFESPKILLFFVLGTKIGDIGAYVTGTLTGKLLPGGNHKMVPSISPGKSWEGAVGGLFFSILWSVFLYGPLAANGTSLVFRIILGTVLFIFGAAGDLAESSIKRTCGVKDSGKTIPGIGGVFDLVDSLMLNAVVFFIISQIWRG